MTHLSCPPSSPTAPNLRPPCLSHSGTILKFEHMRKRESVPNVLLVLHLSHVTRCSRRAAAAVEKKTVEADTDTTDRVERATSHSAVHRGFSPRVLALLYPIRNDVFSFLPLCQKWNRSRSSLSNDWSEILSRSLKSSDLEEGSRRQLMLNCWCPGVVFFGSRRHLNQQQKYNVLIV